MDTKKKAFTVVEILIITIIIGFLIVIALGIIKFNTKQYGAPYYNAYSSLKKAAYNVLADMYKTPPRAFPTISREFCERLIEFINTSEVPTCISDPVNKNADNISNLTPKFVGANSFKYYISDLQDRITIGTKSIDWFIVYVDLNGEKKPNSAAILLDKSGKVKNPLPDIVPFAVTTRGEVMPMGYPLISTQYMTAKVKYPNAFDTADKKLIENRQSPSKAYYIAKINSWGTAEDIGIVETINFTSRLSADNVAKPASGLYPSASIQGTELIGHSNGKKYKAGCVAGEYTCRVIVDSFIGRRF